MNEEYGIVDKVVKINIKLNRDEDKKLVRLALLDLQGNLLGYKTDTFWSLSKEGHKTHYLENVGLESHLIKNLLTGLSESISMNLKDTPWFQKLKEGAIVSVQSVSKSDFGEELARYRIEKTKEGNYIAKEN